MSDQSLKLDGLDQLLKALKDKTNPVVRIGILGSNASASHGDNGPTNAEIGAAHEYGTEHLPVRSFLRSPISKHLNAQLDLSGAFDKRVFANVIAQGSVVPWLQKVAILAEGIVLDAFNTANDGEWKESNMKIKKNHQTLVETQQLRNSITSEIKRNG